MGHPTLALAGAPEGVQGLYEGGKGWRRDLRGGNVRPSQETRAPGILRLEGVLTLCSQVFLTQLSS